MDLKKIAFSQFSFQLPKRIQSTTCGVASLIQTLNFYEILYESPEKVFENFVKLAKYSARYTVLNFPELNFPIPYSIEPEDEGKAVDDLVVQLCEPNSNEYLPTYLLKIGSDARGMSQFLRNLNLKARTFEFKDADSVQFKEDLQNELTLGKWLIASVKLTHIPHLMKRGNREYQERHRFITHLVNLYMLDGDLWMIDPLTREGEEAAMKVDFVEVVKAMTEDRNRGQFISINK
jgi:hypothetical protein